MKRYILTGAPGAGKTTLIKALHQMGYNVITEAATDVIASQQATGIFQPWIKPDFIMDILKLQIEQQNTSGTSTLQFFDRSPLCTLTLCKFLDFTPPRCLEHEINRLKQEDFYEQPVFFIENLGYIENTSARTIDFESALHFEQLHKEVYQAFGYTLINIPALSIEKRTNLILDTLSNI